MKKLFILLLGLIFAMQVIAFAEIRKSAADNFTSIDSSYDLYKDEQKQKGFIMGITVENTRTFARTWSNESQSLRIVVPNMSSNEDSVIFSKKNKPKLEVMKNGQPSNIILDKVTYFSDNSMFLALKRDSLKAAYLADCVYIVLPTKNNGIKKFEIPKSIVAEWETVLSADMKKIRSEMMNR